VWLLSRSIALITFITGLYAPESMLVTALILLLITLTQTLQGLYPPTPADAWCWIGLSTRQLDGIVTVDSYPSVQHLPSGIRVDIGDFVLMRLGGKLRLRLVERIYEGEDRKFLDVRALYWPEESLKGRQKQKDGQHEVFFSHPSDVHAALVEDIVEVCTDRRP